MITINEIKKAMMLAKLDSCLKIEGFHGGGLMSECGVCNRLCHYICIYCSIEAHYHICSDCFKKIQ